MKNFFKKNWFGITMAAGMSLITWLTYIGGKLDGNLEAYSDVMDMCQEALEKVEEESTK